MPAGGGVVLTPMSSSSFSGVSVSQNGRETRMFYGLPREFLGLGFVAGREGGASVADELPAGIGVIARGHRVGHAGAFDRGCGRGRISLCQGDPRPPNTGQSPRPNASRFQICFVARDTMASSP